MKVSTNRIKRRYYLYDRNEIGFQNQRHRHRRSIESLFSRTLSLLESVLIFFPYNNYYVVFLFIPPAVMVLMMVFPTANLKFIEYKRNTIEKKLFCTTEW
jgi:hypothetical protein